jgi:phenylacetate-CoA ligase
LRYHTGDFASLRFSGTQPVLVELDGRPPVVFLGQCGQAVNNIDVTRALRTFNLPRWQLHQAAGGALTLRLPPNIGDRNQVLAALRSLFGPDQIIAVVEAEPLPNLAAKTIQYSREEA